MSKTTEARPSKKDEIRMTGNVVMTDASQNTTECVDFLKALTSILSPGERKTRSVR